MTDRNPYAPPQAEVRDPPPPPDVGNLASRKLRLIGALLDGAANAVVFGPLLLLSGLGPSIMEGVRTGELTYETTVLVALAGMVVFLLLNSYLLATAGQTIGKRLVGTRIVNVSDGQIPKLLTLVGARYGSTWVIGLIPGVGNFYGLIDSLLVFRSDRRCLHDLIAGTKVVNA